MRPSFDYPFDKQTIVWEMSVSSSWNDNIFLYGCHSGGYTSPVLANSMDTGDGVDLNKLFLPASGEWELDGNLEQAIQFKIPERKGQPVLNHCKIEIKIKRNPVVYFVKGLVLTISVVLGCLLVAGYLDPHDHIGDRCAVLVRDAPTEHKIR